MYAASVAARQPRIVQFSLEERPDLRIVSDDLWERAQRTRAAVREAVAPKRNLARGKDARFHSAHLFTGFAKCHVCGGAMTSVSGGMGSPRLGCSRSWNQGRDACPNRLTIRMKVAEPQILARLQSELLLPAALKYITANLGKEVRRALTERPKKEVTVDDSSKSRGASSRTSSPPSRAAPVRRPL